MEVLVLKSALFMLIMSGCATTTSAKYGQNQSLLGLSGHNFTSTGSPCIDGVIVAMDHSCAEAISINEGYPYVTIRCNKTNDSTMWKHYNVVAVTNPEAQSPPGSHMLCADPSARVYVQELSE